jgi:hypothetical protein
VIVVYQSERRVARATDSCVQLVAGTDRCAATVPSPLVSLLATGEARSVRFQADRTLCPEH